MRDIEKRNATHVYPSKLDKKPNYCPINIKGIQGGSQGGSQGRSQGGSLESHDDLNSVEKLIKEYQQTKSKLNKIRGKLYMLGVNPEKYS